MVRLVGGATKQKESLWSEKALSGYPIWGKDMLKKICWNESFVKLVEAAEQQISVIEKAPS